MDDEDKGFFILVLGVLAAVLMVVSWWAIRDTDDVKIAAPELEVEEVAEAEPEPEPTAVPEPEPEAEPEPEPASALPDTVVDIVGGDDDLASLGGLLGDAGLLDALRGEGPFTVLAPSNAAVSAVPEAVAGRLLNEDTIIDTLTYHVIPGVYTAEDLADLIERGARTSELETLQGDTVTIAIDGDAVTINGNSIVTSADAEAGNGVVHTIDTVLVPAEAALNLIVSLEPIQFASGSAEISAESTVTLDRVIDALEDGDGDVVIEGHTDDRGDAVLNQNLSQNRAVSVLNYLVAGGIEEDRLSAEGFGPSEPVASNETEEGRAENRRIEFQLDG